MKRISFFLLLLPSLAFAEIRITPTANFGGGLNVKTQPSDIDDTESPDMSNMINDRYGASFKRNGSKRYIDQALSSQPINSLYRAYAATGTTNTKSLLMTSWDRIYYSSSDIAAQWILLSSGLAHNQHFEFTAVDNVVVMTGDRLTDDIKKFDVMTASLSHLLIHDGSTPSVKVRAKYLLSTRNYLLVANVSDVGLTGSTTYYPNRLYFSLFDNISSFTASRFIDIMPSNSEITGLGELNSYVHIFTENSITELDFKILNLSVFGGDFVTKTAVNGLGLYAPRTLANVGDGYIFGAKTGLRFWDGGRKSRLTIEEESRPLSTKIQPIIDRLIKAGTYKKSVGKYYPRRQWYLFAYEDPQAFPRGRINSLLVLDLVTGNWFPFKNWNAECFSTFDGIGDNGELVYGDSNDGYVYYADQEIFRNDARKELIINTMDSTSTATGEVIWNMGTANYTNVKEGTGSVKVTISGAVNQSSITHMGVINLDEWTDKTKIDKANAEIYFQVFVESFSALQSIRIDLEVNDVHADFDATFTSVTVNAGGLSGGNNAWSTVKVKLSSFPVDDNWVSLSSEAFPFAGNPTYYGIRLVVNGSNDCSVYFDNLRLVQSTERNLDAYRFTKQWNFGSPLSKGFKNLILNTEVNGDDLYNIDIYKDFGEFSKRLNVSGDFKKDLFVSGFGGTNTVARMNSTDFEVTAATYGWLRNVFSIRPIVVNSRYLYGGDHFYNRIIKLDKSSMTVFTSTYGSLGAGTTNFNTIYQLCLDEKYLYVSDFGNNRIKLHDLNTLEFVKSYGTLGRNTTSFHNNTGCAVDERSIYIGNDGNSNILKISKSTGGFETSVNLNLNTIGDVTLSVDEKYLYDAHNLINPTEPEFQNVILEKRDKLSLELVDQVIIRPQNSIAISSYALTGDISIGDEFIYIPFTDDFSGNGKFFIQKRLKSDFSIVKEYQTSDLLFAVAANGLSYKPPKQNLERELGGEGTYLQLKYSESSLDNAMNLYNQSFKLDPYSR